MHDPSGQSGSDACDAAGFASDQLERLRRAVVDLSWLLTRGYAEPSARKLVGDRYALCRRQRQAVMRCACGDAERRDRRSREVASKALAGRTLYVDGYNVLTSIETALGGGLLLIARDGCLRDLASLHGSHRKGGRTVPALSLLGGAMGEWGVERCVWLLDRPVSHSGRLKKAMDQLAERRGWNWGVELVASPDRELIRIDHLVATADSAILDRCGRWFNLARRAVAKKVPTARPVELNGENPQR